ncbi:MAG TPA: UDP-N-acetylglucosamine 2-epimerase (non-hydrolyzing) [Candidatus Sulfotelmatobacter sp.]|nr:UDP-N-acetylglucosamine 2-epimerase (non-hydrolyzing) [Candidatus Sulfotelmatobacter sp.]
MPKFLVVFGTRPEAIKMAPVLRALVGEPQVTAVACSTGQHQEILAQVLSLFDIEPRYNLRVMAPNQQLAALTSVLLTRLEKVMRIERPDRVLVQGDTTTAMVAALAASYQKIPVAHIEAGLRSHNPWEPFPEELNRKLIDVIADMFFAPTTIERNDLLREGKPSEQIHVTGNTSIDALQYVLSLSFCPQAGALAEIPIGTKRIILATVHRRENHGAPLMKICNAIRVLAASYEDSAHIVIPVHPNPNVKAEVHRHLGGIPNITLTEPLGYQDLVTVANAAYFALTDSGGLQEELTWLGKPALVLRNVTDRREAIEAGAAILVGTEARTIVSAAVQLMENPVLYQAMAQPRPLFGDGNAAHRIVHVLLQRQPFVVPRPATLPSVADLRPAA